MTDNPDGLLGMRRLSVKANFNMFDETNVENFYTFATKCLAMHCKTLNDKELEYMA